MGITAFILAYHIRSTSDFIPWIKLPLNLTLFPPLDQYIQFSAAALSVLLIMLAATKMYSLKQQTKLSTETAKILLISTIWIMTIIVYFFVIRDFPFSRLALVYSWILTTFFIIMGRFTIHWLNHILLKNNIGKINLLFVGNNDITKSLYKKLNKNPKYKILGLIGRTTKTKIKNIGEINQLISIIKKYKVEEIIQTVANSETSDILDICREHHIEYSFVPDILKIQQTNVEIEMIDEIPIIKMKQTPLDGWGRVIKRTFDLIGATVGIILLSPILIIIAIAIKIDSKGTVLFKYLDDGSRVKRVGQHGKLFKFYKFRTMYPNTHNLRYTKLSKNNTRKGTPLVKIKNDPRVTKVGKFLRKTSLDELPQLLNVIKGEISLVGPRPHLPEEVEKYDKHHKFVLTIKPGITGLAQISGRSDLNFEEEIKLDTFYIENWSIWKDIIIIIKTFGVIFKQHQE